MKDYQKKKCERFLTLPETKFNPWLKERERECEAQIEKMLDRHESEMISFGFYLRLKWLVSLGTKPTEEEIFPLLTSLTSQPRFEYKVLFKRIEGMNISKTINDRIAEGLEGLEKLKKSETPKQDYQH